MADIDALSVMVIDAESSKKRKVCKNCLLYRTCRKRCHYICLGALVDLLHLRIGEKYVRTDNFILVGAKYIEDLYRWTEDCVYRGLFKDEFVKSVITSVALFAVGIKLTTELVAWKVS